MTRCVLPLCLHDGSGQGPLLRACCRMRQAGMTSCVFEACGGPVRGGAMSALGVEIVIDRTSFRRCRAYDGGAIRFGDTVLNADREGLR
eukprot:2786128-Prymnesium_polylepis.1